MMAEHRSFRLTRASEQRLSRSPAPQASLIRSLKRSLGVLALTGSLWSASLSTQPPFSASFLQECLAVLHAGVFVVFIPMIVTWNRLAMSRQAGASMAAIAGAG